MMVWYNGSMEKDVIGYEGIYKVSNMGVIYPVNPRNKYRLELKPSSDNSGYQIVSLVKDGIKKTKTVHRIVMESFKGSSNQDVNHKNGVKSDNRLINLEYCTKSENIKHAIANGLLKPNYRKIAIEKRKKVQQIDETGLVLAEYPSAHEAARQTGFNRGNISTGCRDNKKFYGFNWRYV